MKLSIHWLKNLVPGLTASPEEIAKRFTAAGLEVEALHAYGKGSEACIVAKVVSMKPHPTKSGLRLVTVDLGGREQEVVCGVLLTCRIPAGSWCSLRSARISPRRT